MSDEPSRSAEQMISRLSGELSAWRRLRGVVALLAGLGGTVMVGTLWATEPGRLPGHTRLAFGLFVVFCLAWAGYGTWMIMRRAPLYALDRVIAGWLAVTASTGVTAVTVAVAAGRGSGLVPALAAGTVFIAVAVALTVRAHARRAALLRRKRELTERADQ
ncbi:hypothetical protein [Planotetraspora kaengkrachanensis]|uniref:Transmembrane transport protein n=1 Tax=Planotetraspora kaengkrachanensis TaxID=575193 RepID=A0A8J3LRM3_9ACTN|nr:hypothetical protein [Planotetraspora kaengkrachanensis]GIG77532.1 hypothetical protein Pka01_06590 [Planotetraspora kaengkrachanensis]